MIIRPARPDDAEAVAAIQNPYIRNTLVTFNSRERTVEEIAKAIQMLPFFAVAEVDKRVTGFVCYDQFRKGPGYARCMEHTILLHPSSFGTGLGRGLMAAAENHAKADGIGSLWAGVSAGNPEGIAFHARIGFQEVARLPKVGYKFGAWIDLVLMRKWLLDDE